MEKGNRRKLAVILSNMEGEYVCEILTGIQREAYAHGMDIYAFNTSVSTDEKLKHSIGEYNIYNLVNYSCFDGVILFPNLIQGYSVYNSVIEKIKASGVFTVSVDAEKEGLFFVGGENYQPMKDLVEHLIEHHHYTKINFVAGQDFNTDNQERLAAYCDALREHGIPVEEERIFRGAFTNVHGRAAAMKMLETPHLMPEAVVCATDSLAIGVRTVFSERGVKIPEQVALVGFDNVFEARNSIPRLTTVSRDPEHMGQEIVRFIVRRLAGEEVTMQKKFPGIPVFRESCGCCSEDEEDIEVLHHKYLKMSQLYEKYSISTNIMIEDLNASRDFEDFKKRIKRHVEEKHYEAFYLCMNKSLVDDLSDTGTEEEPGRIHDDFLVEGYPETMCVVAACENGEIVERENFPSAQMLPKLPGKGEPPHTYLFLPLHFRERSMGYVVVQNDNFMRIGSFFRTRIMNLANSLESLRKQKSLRRMVTQIDRMYVADSLTGLYNRFGFNRFAKESFDRCAAQKSSCMILFIDLDGLKEINDRYGHDNGDVAISLMAYAIRSACRGNEICARMGGDEFVVYAEGYSEDDAASYCERLDNLLEKVNEDLQKPYRVAASYGYEVVFPDAEAVLERYVDMADGKMYINKQKKRGESPFNV